MKLLIIIILLGLPVAGFKIHENHCRYYGGERLGTICCGYFTVYDNMVGSSFFVE